MKKESVLVLPVVAREVEELAIGGEDEESELDVAENRELQRLLHQTTPPLREGDVAAVLVLDPLHLHFPSSHLSPRPLRFRCETLTLSLSLTHSPRR